MQRYDGTRLAAARRQQRKSREQLALEVGRSYGTITLYERGQVVPPGPVLCALADALDCTVDDFFPEAGAVKDAA